MAYKRWSPQHKKAAASLAVGLVAWSFLDAGGFVLGCLVGYLLWEHREAAARQERLERQLWELAKQVRLQGAERHEPASAAPTEETAEAEERPAGPSEETVLEPSPPLQPEPDRPARPDRPAVRSAPEKAPPIARQGNPLFEQVKGFLYRGNVLVRAGVVVLFFGLAFLVKYAADNDYFPLSLRLATAAAAGLALTGLGWRLRQRRPDFALALQGGGTAVLYLTIFAAFRLYGFLPSGLAFALLVATTVLGAALALLQEAQSLAVLSLLGGLFAPVLTSTGEGSLLALFSYYALLNAAVVAIAWFRTWRSLPLVGFFCTFVLAGVWVVGWYEPALFSLSEPFLAFFFLCYFAIALLQVRRRAAAGPVDGTLIFGLPVVVFSLQAVLVDPFAYGLAWSAFVLGGVYAAAAYVLYRRASEAQRLLAESFAGIALVLETLVLPFALDAVWTGTGWALEGTALVWLGLRQRRALLRLFGALLQGAAGVSFLIGYVPPGAEAVPVLNHFFFGCLVLSLSALCTAFLVQRHRERVRPWENPLEGIFLAAGLVWWLVGGIGEIDRVIGGDLGYHLAVGFVSVTALGCALLRRPLGWRALRIPALLILPALVLLLLAEASTIAHPFEAGGFVVWPLGIAVHLLALRLNEDEVPREAARLLHAAGLWLTALVLVWEGGWAVGRLAPAGTVWPSLAHGLLLVLIVLAATKLASRGAWPFGTWRRGYLLPGVAPLLTAAWYWSIHISLKHPADPAPLPYLPLANPLDMVLGAGVAVAVLWYRTSRHLLPDFGARELQRLLLWMLSGTIFLWLNASLARSVHFWADVPYDFSALLGSTTFQTALTIFWTVLAVTTMAASARRGARTPWLAAAVLLGITVVKLFLVDLSSIGTVARIVTFLIVGLLLLVVGYLAPVPPQHAGAPKEPAQTSV